MNAIIFDLDGVLCHTDEYHYMAWKAIADELHIPFNREVNNQLRGVSRMESLKLVLRNSPVRYSEREKFLLAEKKNNIYRELLQNITSKDLADGAWTVLEKLHAVHIPMAIGSSSKNTPLIVEKLGIGKFFDAIVDGNQISHVAYLHIKDKAGARDAWDFPALGKGYVDFKTLFNKLDKANNDAPLSLEIEFTAKGPKDLDEINTAVKESAAYLENLGYKI